MDPADLRSSLAEALGSGRQLTAEELNMACFWMSTQLESLHFTSAEAAAVGRRLLRAMGRIFIDGAGEGARPEDWPNTREMVLTWLDEAVRPLGCAVTPQSASETS